jgi:hypothetical protein
MSGIFQESSTIYKVYKNKKKIKTINTEDELKKFVRINEKIRVIGGSMNWNGSCFGENTIKLGGDFCKYKIISENIIKVGGGCMICDVHKYLLDKKLQLPSIGLCLFSNKSQTIGGLCASNVHHTGKEVKPFSETCTEIKVLHFNINNQPVVNNYYPSDTFFKYYFGSLGTLGILLSASFSIQPLKYYKIKDKSISNYNTEEITDGLKNQNGYYGFNTNTMTTYKTYIPKKYTIENLDNTTIIPVINIGSLHDLLRIIPNNIKNIIFKSSSLINPLLERIVTSTSHLSDSFHVLFPHIEIEIYINEKDVNEIISFINDKKLIDNFLIVLRHIQKMNNSAFAFKENQVTVTFISFNMDINEMNDLFDLIRRKLSINWYPHFGKFIGDNYKFSNFFDLTEYNKIRRDVDPFNKFISKFN